MKLLVIVLCLLSERFLIHSVSYQRFNWFESYCVLIDRFLERNNLPNHASFILGLTTLPLILAAGLVYWLVHGFFGVGFIVSMILFFYSLGPDNPFYPELKDDSDSSDTSDVSAYLVQVNNQLFSVVFWYVIGGPIACLAFRLVALSQNNLKTKYFAKDVTEALEWIPARITVLIYLLVGNFQAGFKRYSQLFLAKPASNTQLLQDCGLLALQSSQEDKAPMALAEQFFEHAVILLVVFIALLTLAALL